MGSRTRKMADLELFYCDGRRSGEETETSFSLRQGGADDDEEEEEDSRGGSRSSADYGFFVAVFCLVAGVSLVAISFSIPREVRVDPDSVSAREMERLERDRAGVEAQLDRCVIAGLSLLTLGGALLSMLLMVSMWKEQKMRRRALAYCQHSASLYGSTSTLDPTCSTFPAEEDLQPFS